MQTTAPPILFYRAASNRPPELSSTAAVRLKLLEQWRAIRAEGATAARAADILRVPRANRYRWEARLNERGLRGLEPDARRWGVDDGAAEPRAAGVGGAFLYENRRQSLGWRTPMEHLAERRLEEAS